MKQVNISLSFSVPDWLYEGVIFGYRLFWYIWYRVWQGLTLPFVWAGTQLRTGWLWLKFYLLRPHPGSHHRAFSWELALVLVGLGFVYLPRWWEAYLFKPGVPIAVEASPISKTTELPLPQRVVIPQLVLDLEVKAATISGNTWQLYENQVSWLSSGGHPGEAANTVLYAHNRRQLFGPLYGAYLKMPIYVLSDQGWTTYEVTEIKQVPATAIDEVLPTPEAILTLFTCADFWDFSQYRLVIKAKLANRTGSI